jgi:transposase
VLCGIDWAEDHHDVAIVDSDGNLLVKRRIGDDAEGFAQLLALFVAAGEDPVDPIPVAIETGRDCWSRACVPHPSNAGTFDRTDRPGCAVASGV